MKIGSVYNRLTVLSLFKERRLCKSRKTGYRDYDTAKCKCSCGKTVDILSYNVKVGITQSCGCLSREKARERMLNKDACIERINNYVSYIEYPTNLPNEIWKYCIGFEGYYSVSNEGRVRSEPRVSCRGFVVRSIILRPAMNYYGYLHVGLSVDGISTSKDVHVLVANAFLGPRPKGKEVRHKDSITSNCKLSNLAYSYPMRNAFDKLGEGSVPLCSNSGKSKLRAEDVIGIRNARGSKTHTEIAKYYGISRGHVSDVQLHKCWDSNSLKKALCQMKIATKKLHGGIWSEGRKAAYWRMKREYDILTGVS